MSLKDGHHRNRFNIIYIIRNLSVFNITLRSVSYRYSYPLERSRSTDLETSRFLFKQNCNF